MAKCISNKNLMAEGGGKIPYGRDHRHRRTRQACYSSENEVSDGCNGHTSGAKKSKDHNVNEDSILSQFHTKDIERKSGSQTQGMWLFFVKRSTFECIYYKSELIRLC